MEREKVLSKHSENRIYRKEKEMNKVILVGRLTKDVEARYSGETCVARYSLAVDRKFKQDGQPSADFINCVAFGKSGEFAEKYLRKGMKVAIAGRIQTGSYTDKNGNKVYTTDIVVEEHEFCESKQTEPTNTQATPPPTPSTMTDVFMKIPDDIQEELPFN